MSHRCVPQKTILCIDERQKSSILRSIALNPSDYLVLQVGDVDMAAGAFEMFEVDLVVTTRRLTVIESAKLQKRLKSRIELPLVLGNQLFERYIDETLPSELIDRIATLLGKEQDTGCC